MKQLGLGLLQYAQDYDEKFPAGRHASKTAGWAGSVYNYLKSSQIFACPNDPTQPDVTTKQIVSYGINDSLLGDQNNGSGAALSSFNATALTVMLCETQNNYVDTTNPNADIDSPGATCSNNFWSGKPSPGGASDSYATGPIPNQTIVTTAWPTGRHLDGSNWLAVDGHVKWFKGTKISGGKDAASAASAEVANNTAAGTENMGAAALTFSKKYALCKVVVYDSTTRDDEQEHKGRQSKGENDEFILALSFVMGKAGLER